MNTSLALTALTMGLVGGPHCLAMCGAPCAAVASSGGVRATAGFQLGRLLGYASLGAVAAASVQSLGWMTTQSAALRPVWTMFHVAALLLGLVLLAQARQPVWLESGARRIWQRARAVGAGRGPVVLGALWALLPCGLLYSALLVAAMAGDPLSGALVMAAFALGSAITLIAGPWLWLKLRGASPEHGAWGIRLAGLALALSSGAVLWMGLVHGAAPWCVTT